MKVKVSQVTADLGPAYATDIAQAKTLAALRRILRDWRDLAPDAVAVAGEMQGQGWIDFAEGLAKERRGEFAGQRWAEVYGPILIPERLLRTTLTAAKFSVPWGSAYLRLKELGWPK